MALILDIARGSEVDGPGLRTVVFLKGCPLRCVWCHNPEGQRFEPEIGFDLRRCVGCGACAESCPRGAIDLLSAERIRRRDCTACGACAGACDSLALRRLGRAYSREELLELILRDRAFFDVSGGGVTFSGGEPLAHIGFLGPLVRRLKEERIHVAIETCGDFDYARFRREVLPWIDCVLYDIKVVDPEEHRRLTGRRNERIVQNLRALIAEERVVVLPRVPLVPELTATPENLAAIAALLRSLGLRSYALLTYNPSGIGKWRQLGRDAPGGLSGELIPLAEERAIRADFDRRARP